MNGDLQELSQGGLQIACQAQAYANIALGSQQGLISFSRCNILGNAGDAVDFAGCVTHRECPIVDPSDFARRAPNAILDTRAAGLIHLFHPFGDSFAVLGVNPNGPGESVCIELLTRSFPDGFATGTDIKQLALLQISQPE